MVTRLAKTRRVAELIETAPKRKKRLHEMKELANKYVLESNKYVDKDCFYFNNFYKEKKIIYPWLEKESFRWHVRKRMAKKECNVPKQSQKTLSNETKYQVSHGYLIVIDNIYCFVVWGRTRVHFEHVILEA